MIFRDERGRFAKKPKSEYFNWGLTMDGKVGRRIEGDKDRLEITYSVAGYDYRFKLIMEKFGQYGPIGKHKNKMILQVKICIPVEHNSLPLDCQTVEISRIISSTGSGTRGINGRNYFISKLLFHGYSYPRIRNFAIRKTNKIFAKMFSQMLLRQRIRNNAGNLI